MTTQEISRWLQAPDNTPGEDSVSAMLESWPWFVPARLMDASRRHAQRPFGPQTLSDIQLYGTDWVTTYRILSGVNSYPIGARKNVAAHASIVDDKTRELLNEDLKIETNVESVDLVQENIIQPLYSEDYFRHQGIKTQAVEPEPLVVKSILSEQEDPKTLMVVMSFTEWLTHFKTKGEREKEDAREKSALRSMWQQEKLAAVLGDDPEEIPEDVFEMAVSSITREDDLASESLAEILERQEKWTAAADMYRKLGLLNPAKRSYFASRAEAAKKRSL